MLAVSEDSSHLTLFGSNGLPRGSLSEQGDGVRLKLWNASGNAVSLTQVMSFQSDQKEGTTSDGESRADDEIS